MFILANLVSALAVVLGYLLEFYMWVILVRALLSWVNPDPYNPIVQFLYRVTEPILHPIRQRMGMYTSGIDLSPMIVILVIIFLKTFLIASLYDFANRLQ